MLTAETVTDDQIKEEIAQLDTEIAILHAALRIQRGPLVAKMRVATAEIINTRAGRKDARIATLETVYEAAKVWRRTTEVRLTTHADCELWRVMTNALESETI